MPEPEYPPNHERDDNENLRESIWSVRSDDRASFARWFSVLFVIGMGFMAWYEIDHAVTDGFFDTLVAIGLGSGPIGVASVVITFFRFEGGDTMGVALDAYRRKQFREGRQVGREEGRQEGIRMGREENRAEIEALRKRIAELEKRNGNPTDA